MPKFFRFGAFRFAPPWWAWLIFIPLLCLLLNLGAWQLRRAHAKEAMLAAHAVSAKAEAADLVAHLWAGGDGESLRGEGVRLTGHFMNDRVLLQDSQVLKGQVGYHVWTPLVTRVGLILVNRGWIAPGESRDVLPEFETPDGMVTLKGQWRSLPRPGLRLAEDVCDAGFANENWPRVVQYPRREALKCLLGAPVKDGIVLLAADQPHGFARDWTAEVMPPAKHYGYAFQWFALALALSVIFIAVNTRREPATPR